MRDPTEGLAEFALYVTGRPLAKGLPVPHMTVGWSAVAFAIAEAVHRPVKWRQRAEHQRRRLELDKTLERLLERDYLDSGFAVGQGRRAVSNAKNLLRRAEVRGGKDAMPADLARAEARRYLLSANTALATSETALLLTQRLICKRRRLLADAKAYVELVDTWCQHLSDATRMLFRLGADGYVQGAITVDNSGQAHPMQSEAWSTTHNIETFNTRRILYPGDAPLSPPGMPCVPVDVLKEWVRLIELHRPISIAEAEKLISGKQRPGETDYEWLYRCGVRGTILQAEALTYARLEEPDADPQVLKRRAKSLVSTSRSIPGARKRGAKQQRKRAPRRKP